MPKSFEPDMGQYVQVKDVGNKAEADKYIQAGWEFIEIYNEVSGVYGYGETHIIYRVGWPKGEGEPVEPQKTEGLPKLDRGSSAN